MRSDSDRLNKSPEHPVNPSVGLSITRIAIFAAFSLFLSTLEYMIPKPLPFLRIGLANLPVMISLSLFTLPEYLLLVTLKVAGQGLVNGTLFSYIFLFSIGGSFASAAVMFLLHRTLKRSVSYVGISTAGALSSNIIQLYLAHLLLFGGSIWIIAPPFLLAGLVTSVLLGLFANYFTRTSRWFSAAKELKGQECLIGKGPSDTDLPGSDEHRTISSGSGGGRNGQG